MSDADISGESGQRREVQTRLANIDEVSPQYANLVHVNTDRLMFQVVFSRFLQPVVSTEADRERLQAADTLDAEVVARLLLSPEVVDQTIQLLQAFLNEYYVRAAQSEDEPYGGY